VSEALFQQVNLYQPIFRRQRHIFSATTMLQGVAVVAVALMTIYAYGAWQVAMLEAQAAELMSREDAYSGQLARLDSSDGGSRRQEIDAALEDLSATLLAQQHLMAVLEEQPLGDTGGFSAALAALARRHSPGLWLTELRIRGGTGSIQVAGRTTDPGLIPAYLLSLSDEEALVGRRFDEFEIQRSDEGDEVTFRVASRKVAQ
jgi:Tfp pilus assembly protein PilN